MKDANLFLPLTHGQFQATLVVVRDAVGATDWAVDKGTRVFAMTPGVTVHGAEAHAAKRTHTGVTGSCRRREKEKD